MCAAHRSLWHQIRSKFRSHRLSFPDLTVLLRDPPGRPNTLSTWLEFLPPRRNNIIGDNSSRGNSAPFNRHSWQNGDSDSQPAFFTNLDRSCRAVRCPTVKIIETMAHNLNLTARPNIRAVFDRHQAHVQTYETGREYSVTSWPTLTICKLTQRPQKHHHQSRYRSP